MHLLRLPVLSCVLAICLLTSCSPALNWRQLSVPGSSLRAMLPCDPKTVTHAAASGPAPGLGAVSITATGCEADGATYAISHFGLAEPQRAGEVLGYWQASARQQAGTAVPPDGAGQGFVPPGALNLPQSQRAHFSVSDASGARQPVQGAWFARAEPGGVRLFAALIYGGKPSTETQEMFFSALQLQ